MYLLNLAFRLALGRNPQADELESVREHYQNSLKDAKKTQPPEVKYPKYVVREMVEEMTGLAFYWVEELDVYQGDYLPDLKPKDVDARTRSLADICLVLFNSNEFIYVY